MAPTAGSLLGEIAVPGQGAMQTRIATGAKQQKHEHTGLTHVYFSPSYAVLTIHKATRDSRIICGSRPLHRTCHFLRYATISFTFVYVSIQSAIDLAIAG